MKTLITLLIGHKNKINAYYTYCISLYCLIKNLAKEKLSWIKKKYIYSKGKKNKNQPRINLPLNLRRMTCIKNLSLTYSNIIYQFFKCEIKECLYVYTKFKSPNVISIVKLSPS